MTKLNSKRQQLPKPIYLTIGIILLLIIPLVLLISSSLNNGVKSPATPTFPGNTLIIAAEGDFAFKNTTNEFATHFKAKPTEPESIVFANDLGNISFYTPQNQSFGEINSDNPPVSTGSTLTYSNIFPQTDLRYIISSSRLLEEFIIKDKATANKVTRIKQIAKTDSDYTENADGSITFKKDGKTTFTLPHPVLYELDNIDNRSEGIKYEIKKENNQLIITKVITSQGLTWINDPNRQYPIVIDLVIDNADTAANWVSSDPTNTTVSQETTLKQEGTGSVKVQTTSQSASAIDFMEYPSSTIAQEAYITNSFFANGGTITTSGGYRTHTFTSSGTLSVFGGGNTEVLLVGGGGGGGTDTLTNGGGGGGGVVQNASFAVSPGNISVTVGGGGAVLTNGGNSVFSTLTAYGGGAGVNQTNNGADGASGGGAAGWNLSGTRYGGTGTQGYNGGNVNGSDTDKGYASGGGGGAGQAGGNGGLITGNTWQAGDGGDGVSSSISGAATYYGGGGGGRGRAGLHGSGGLGGGGDGAVSAGTSGLGGGGGADYPGGSGVAIIRYPDPTALEVYSESTIKTEGSYSLKGVAQATTSLNKTLTKTLTTKLNLSNLSTATFDIRASRTGSNIKVGLHDSGGTTTEVTPNIAVADTFQSATIDLSGVSNANKDDIDSVIVTILNADSINTFYIDNLIYYGYADTVDLMEYSSDANAQTAYVTSTLLDDTDTESLLHMDGADTSTTFTDEHSKTWTARNHAQIDTAQSKFGGASGIFDGTDDYIDTPDSADWFLDTGDFTIEFWARFNNTTTATQGFVEQYVDSSNRWGFWMNAANIQFHAYMGGTTRAYYTFAHGLSTGTWYHIALVRSGTNVYIFVNGVAQTLTVTNAIGTNSLTDLASALSVGRSYYDAAWKYLNGWMDEFRFTKGVARWTSNFTPPTLAYSGVQVFSESTTKTQGTYSIKGIAEATYSLNQTLTRTIGSPLNLSGADSVDFDIYAGRTGSNIKVGIHDSGGTTTEITPNVTSANAWQDVSLDLTAVSDANKDAIDQIIITIVNADADNTFYLDNMTYIHSSIDDTVTLTKAATDLSSINYIFFWVRSSVAGSFVRFQFGETVSTEQTYPVTVSLANTWEQKVWDISGISASARNAVTKFAFQTTSDAYGAAFYFDDMSGNSPPSTPSLDLPTDAATNQITLPVLKTTTTDADSDYLRYKITFCTNSVMTANCQTFDQTTSQTGWSGQNTQSNTAYTSGTQAVYTIQTALTNGSTYYWKSQAIDPAGTNYWSSTQTTPYSFSVISLPATASNCRIDETLKDTSLTFNWVDVATDENYYEVQRSVDGGDFAVFATGLAANTQSSTDSTITNGHTYQYKVAPYKTIGPTYSAWCTTTTLSLQTGTFSIKGLNLKGLELH